MMMMNSHPLHWVSIDGGASLVARWSPSASLRSEIILFRQYADSIGQNTHVVELT